MSKRLLTGFATLTVVAALASAVGAQERRPTEKAPPEVSAQNTDTLAPDAAAVGPPAEAAGPQKAKPKKILPLEEKRKRLQPTAGGAS